MNSQHSHFYTFCYGNPIYTLPTVKHANSKDVKNTGTSLVVQWLRIRLQMQGTRVGSLVWKIPHATEQQSPCATTTEPVL